MGLGVEAGVAAGNVAVVIYGLMCLPRAFQLAIARPGPDRMAALEIAAVAMLGALMVSIAIAGYYASARLVAPWLWQSWLALTLMRLIEMPALVILAIAWWRLLGVTGRALALRGAMEVAMALSIFTVVLWRMW